MFRTAMACLLSLLLAWAAAQGLTRDFQVWTAEGARRHDSALRPLPALSVAIEGPGQPARPLPQVLAGEQAVTLLDFMYTRCISVCAALGSAFQQLQANIAPDEPLRLLSISFDPAHDTPAVLARYAAGLKADPQLWRFARVADPADQAALLAHYQVTVIPDGRGGFEHNAALLVLDASGRLRRVFDYTELDGALAYARHLSHAEP